MDHWETATWLITGTSSGFGRELAKSVLAGGGRVIATARRPETLQALQAEAPDRVLACELDVARAEHIEAAVAAGERRFGGIDVLVNNAGYGLIGGVEQIPQADYRQMFEVNLFGLIAATRAVLPNMRARRRGFIVNISSTAGMRGHPGSAFYSASKFAVEGFTESLRAEVGPLGIGAMAVEPGFFKTEFGQNAQLQASVLPDYANTVGVTLKMMNAMKGREPGDPARAARAIIGAMNEPQPPAQLALGAGAFQGITTTLAERLANFRSREAQALGADFPKT